MSGNKAWSAFAVVTLVVLNVTLIRSVLSFDAPTEHRHAAEAALIAELVPTAVLTPDGVVAIAIVNPYEPLMLARFVRDIGDAALKGRFRAVSIAAKDRPGGDVTAFAWRHFALEPAVISDALRRTGLGASRWAVFRDGRLMEAGLVRNGGMRAALEEMLFPAQPLDSRLAREIAPLVHAGDIPVRPADATQFVLLTRRLNATCPASRVVKDMEAHLVKLRGRLQVVVTSDWTIDDVAALRDTLNLTLPLDRLSDRGTSALLDLEGKYGRFMGGGILVVVSRGSVAVVSDLPDITSRLRAEVGG